MQKSIGTSLIIIILIWVTIYIRNHNASGFQSPIQKHSDEIATFAEIPELGIRMQLPDRLKDITYTVSENNKTILFSSTSLKALDDANGGSDCAEPNAPLGYISTDQSYFTARGVEPTESEFIHKVGDTWVYYISPQSTCSQAKTVQDLQTSQMLALQQAFRAVTPASPNTKAQ